MLLLIIFMMMRLNKIVAGYAGIKKDGLWGSIDLNGNIVTQPTYNLDNNLKIDFIGSWHLCEDVNANYYLDV